VEETTGGSVGGMEFREVARIIISMDRAEAMLLLSYLEDDQVLGILRSMRVRDAARTLELIPKDRAASLSARLLQLSEEKGK
jgi:Mg/Co/Ni transporter MgtE